MCACLPAEGSGLARGTEAACRPPAGPPGTRMPAYLSACHQGATPRSGKHGRLLVNGPLLLCRRRQARYVLQGLQWHDARDTAFSSVDFDACWGLILNIKGTGFLAPWRGSRHWIGLRRFQGIW